MKAPIPQRIHRDDRAVVITWSAEHVSHYPSRALRLECRCASCREEMTGRRLLNPETVPNDVSPVSIALVGSYAMRVVWSDGHETGIYTWELLAELCGCDRCRGAGEQRGQ